MEMTHDPAFLSFGVLSEDLGWEINPFCAGLAGTSRLWAGSAVFCGNGAQVSFVGGI